MEGRLLILVGLYLYSYTNVLAANDGCFPEEEVSQPELVCVEPLHLLLPNTWLSSAA